MAVTINVMCKHSQCPPMHEPSRQSNGSPKPVARNLPNFAAPIVIGGSYSGKAAARQFRQVLVTDAGLRRNAFCQPFACLPVPGRRRSGRDHGTVA